MIKITKEGAKMLEQMFASRGIRKMQIVHERPACAACRHQLRLVPGEAGPGDEICVVSGYAFSIDPKLLARVECIIVDAAGNIPVLFARGPIDPLERV